MRRASQVPDQPASRPAARWSWLHFVCGFVPVALLAFFDVNMPLFRTLGTHVVETVVIASLCGTLTALFGERAFVKMLELLRWW